MSTDDGLIPLRALANPLRMRIVSLLTGVSMSATEVADELGIAHASASYHLRRLAEAGFLQRVDEPPRTGKGRPRVCYRYDPSSSERIDRSEGRLLLHQAMSDDLVRRLAETERQRMSMDAEVWLARPVWEEIVGLVGQAVALLHDKAGPPHDGVKVSMTALLLELGEEAPCDRSPR
ncbi:Helix-turn-helix domain protein [Nonomuraea coxensis DSM 45129]|uniref:Helix-turn-helix domain protein n=1 Tax=Nonomuraea coxensis DSM 45129 TaxID=1122611 RepID=A0ABX8U9T1_9ACTN|nr:helix-turn-helix domain-containing protein [Nonomuraea coxensis]QYC44186.1 Helix-turn-helix domain protein [Nonomuraea coxensis DSM 45129]